MSKTHTRKEVKMTMRRGTHVEYTSLSGETVKGIVWCKVEGGRICVKVGGLFIYVYANALRRSK
jgi:hypothetical protein